MITSFTPPKMPFYYRWACKVSKAVGGGHIWRIMRINTERAAKLSHLNPIAGCDAYCERCGEKYLDFNNKITKVVEPEAVESWDPLAVDEDINHPSHYGSRTHLRRPSRLMICNDCCLVTQEDECPACGSDTSEHPDLDEESEHDPNDPFPWIP